MRERILPSTIIRYLSNMQVCGSLKTCIHLMTSATLSKGYEAALAQPGIGISSTAVQLETASNSFTSTDCPTGTFLCTIQTTVVGAFFADDTLALSMPGSVLMKSVVVRWESPCPPPCVAQ
jgi:hypothetical protein